MIIVMDLHRQYATPMKIDAGSVVEAHFIMQQIINRHGEQALISLDGGKNVMRLNDSANDYKYMTLDEYLTTLRDIKDELD